MDYFIFLLTGMLLCGLMLGITIRHYFADNIPFDRLFDRLETFLNKTETLLYKLKKNKYVRSVCKMLKKLAVMTASVLKWLIRKLIENRTAIWNAMKKLLISAKEACNGDDIRKLLPDNTLALEHGDTVALTGKMAGHPYDTPAFADYSCRDGIAWYDFRAFGLSGRYGDLDRESLAVMLEHIIRNHMWETRGRRAVIFIRMATPTRLNFGIALSRCGEEELEKEREKQRQAASHAGKEEKQTVLEEEIDLLGSEEDEG